MTVQMELVAQDMMVVQWSPRHFSCRPFKHYSLNRLQSQEPKAEGSKVRAALLLFKSRICYYLFESLFSSPLLPSTLSLN